MRRSATTPLESRKGSRSGSRISRRAMRSMWTAFRVRALFVSRSELIAGEVGGGAAVETDDIVPAGQVVRERVARDRAPARAACGGLGIGVARNGEADHGGVRPFADDGHSV